MLSNTVPLLAVLAAIMTISGCQSTPARPSGAAEVPAVTKAPEPARGARPGTHLDVTAELDDAELWLASDDPYLARVSLQRIDFAALGGAAAERAARLQIESDLALGLEAEAAAWLASVELDPADNARLRAQICERARRHACVAEQLMVASEYSPDPAESNERIWAALVASSVQSERLAAAGSQSAEGWLALLGLVRDARSIIEERAAFASWRERFPSHPALVRLPSALAYLEMPHASTLTVVVLLPLSGPLEAIGQAVRDGMMSVHVYDAGADTPTLRFVDTGSLAMRELYASARASNADVILGPVVREGVAGLAGLAPDIPVLALNYLEAGSAPANFFQVGLAIEDEARDIAAALTARQRNKVLFVAANTPWAARALREIQHRWQGKPTIIRVNDSKDLTAAVGGALRSTPSYLRKSSLQNLLATTVVFDSGLRHDLEAIVALTDPVQTSTLGPALRFHSVRDVDIFLGTQSIRNGGDVSSLRGAMVSELPVMLNDDDFSRSLRSAWVGQSAADISFYALGADAYRLLRRLPAAGDSAPAATRLVWGSSGLLTLTAQNRFERTQSWGVVSNQRLVAAPINR